jgi:hypothetical protein
MDAEQRRIAGRTDTERLNILLLSRRDAVDIRQRHKQCHRLGQRDRRPGTTRPCCTRMTLPMCPPSSTTAIRRAPEMCPAQPSSFRYRRSRMEESTSVRRPTLTSTDCCSTHGWFARRPSSRPYPHSEPEVGFYSFGALMTAFRLWWSARRPESPPDYANPVQI